MTFREKLISILQSNLGLRLGGKKFNPRKSRVCTMASNSVNNAFSNVKMCSFWNETSHSKLFNCHAFKLLSKQERYDYMLSRLDVARDV